MVVGLTGGIASGKSYVTNYLKDLDYLVVDTDSLYHDLIKKDNRCYNVLKNVFPYFNQDLSLDLKKIRNIVFNDKSKLELLNSIVHPIIYDETKKIIDKNKDKIIFIDAPLLFEASFDTLCDLVVCVYVSKDEQINRLIARDNITKEEALKIINNQMDLEERKSKSDILLESCDDFNDTNKNILNMLERIKSYGKGI